jgi:dolichol kinase
MHPAEARKKVQEEINQRIERFGLRPAEVQRKAIHLSSSLIPLAIFILPAEVGEGLAATVLILAIVVDVIRLRVPAVQEFFHRTFGTAMRPHEAWELTGSTYLCLAALVCIVLFPVPIAVGALFFLTVGDTLAALVGQRWGKHPLRPGKTLEGTLANLVSCVLIGVLVPGIPLAAGLVGALVATVVELFGTAAIDDNFGIPVLSALAMWIVASLVI